MLLAKINPPAKVIRQDGPFSETSEVVGEWMKASAERYELGTKSARFVVQFGYLVPHGIDKFNFETLHRATINLDETEINDWGTDDSILFPILASHFGTSVVTIEEKNILNDY